MKAFVTGGTGFIGRHVVQKLIERGQEVHALARSEQGVASLAAMGAVPVSGDITDVDSMREGMRGSDVVYHIAGWYKLGSSDWRNAEIINVQGTRNVLVLAEELGIPKIIYTSTVGVLGDTRGKLVDENYIAPKGPFLTEYDRTKWLAHYRVAVPMIEQGAPIIILMPGGVYGPQDPSLIGELMRRYYAGQFPIFPGPEFTITYAHVEDIAEGHILAAEKGRLGESYILAGPAVSTGEMVKIWSEVAHKPAPIFSVPAKYLKPFAPLMAILSQWFHLPEIFSRDAVAILEATYIARSDKARSELGWTTRPLRQGMRETFDWIAQIAKPAKPVSIPRRSLAGLAAGAALGLLFAWLLTRRRK